MDIDDLLDRLEREPTTRWHLLLQQRSYQTPAVAEGLMYRAVAHRNNDYKLCLAYAEAAVTIAGGLSPQCRHLHAQALAEFGNALRNHDRYALAAQRIQEAEALVDDQTPMTVKGEILSFKASLLRDQRLFGAAAEAARIAASIFHRAGQPLEEARNLAKLGHIHIQARQVWRAKWVFERALDLMIHDERVLYELRVASPEFQHRYWTLVCRVQVNGLLIGVQQAEAEEDPAVRDRFIRTAMEVFSSISKSVKETLPPHESIHLDWIWSRLMIVEGKHEIAADTLKAVRDWFAEEGMLVSSADAGMDLLVAYAQQEDLERVNQEAARMLEIYGQHDLLPDQLTVLEALVTVNNGLEATQLVRKRRNVSFPE